MTPASLSVKAPGSSPSRRGLILHGILGSAKNWRSFARSLSAKAPDWEWVLADLRGHGDSPSGTPPHTLQKCAEDLLALGPFDIVVGHSFGGKVALSYAATTPHPLEEVWVLDTNPGAATENMNRLGTQDISRVLGALLEIPLPIPSRDHLVTTLQGQGFTSSLALWMTTNLKPSDNGFEWRFDLQTVAELLRNYLTVDHFPTLVSPSYTCHLVRAERTVWPTEDISRLEAMSRYPSFNYHTLGNSGHWVHVDAPQALAALLLSSLRAK